jgi:hypothetical protein
VIVERTIRLPNRQEREGLAVSPPARAIFDATRRLGRADDVRAIAAEAIQRGITSPAAINRELREGQMRGSAMLRSAMSEVDAGVRSLAEADARRLVHRSPRLRTMWWNPRVTTRDGAFLLIPDGWLDDIALAWQIDSLEFHLSPQDYAMTLRRHTTAVAHGIVVVHHLPSDLGRRPKEVLHDLEAAADVAASRPRPDVYARRAFDDVA